MRLDPGEYTDFHPDPLRKPPDGVAPRTITGVSAEPGRERAMMVDVSALADQLRRRLADIDGVCTDLSSRHRVSASSAHALRRQCRKADVALRLLDRGESAGERLRRRIRNLRRRVGEVRDFDVVHALITSLELAAEHEPARCALLSILAAKRNDAAGRLLAFLRRHPHARLRKVGIAHDPSRATADSVRRALAAMHHRWLERLSIHPSSAHQLHAARLAGKRLASALRLLDAPPDETAPVEDLVAELGISNDLSVAAELARDLAPEGGNLAFEHVLSVLDAMATARRTAAAARVLDRWEFERIRSASSAASDATRSP